MAAATAAATPCRPSSRRPATRVLTATDLVPPLLRVLTEIGFEPELRADEATIALPACPFRAEARANPDVVCSVHLGLMKGLARSLGHDATGIRLQPFVQPALCLVHLPTPSRTERKAPSSSQTWGFSHSSRGVRPRRRTRPLGW